MYQKIMVPLDGSELAECVLSQVEIFASGCRVNTIVFVRVVEPTSLVTRGAYGEVLEQIETDPNKIDAERKHNAAKYLQKVVSRLKPQGVKYQTEVLYGRVAERLVDYAEANAVDLIIIATHGRSGVSRWVRGSIADRILRAASVPVLMVRAPGTIVEHAELKKSENPRQPHALERYWVD